MFDNTVNTSWDERSRRGLTTITSFGVQALAVGVLLIVPLLRPVALPFMHQLSMPISLGRPLGAPPVTAVRSGPTPASHSSVLDLTLRQPRRIPNGIPPASDDGPPQLPGIGSSSPGGDVIGDPHGIPGILATGSQPVLPVEPAHVKTPPIRISHMSEGDLIRKVMPTYPTLARSARIQGQVVLQAVISKQGMIENLRLIAGHPMLVPAAIEAVRQWHYRPYILNNEPVEVETQITVNFSLGGN